ncbi:MAG: hypothetical protein CMI36_02780 [Owenweeksia sp.]|nr:hypothetical protein [Owenweeksia sp.]
MHRLTIFLFTALLFFSGNGYAQDKQEPEAGDIIRQLKESFILVRLQTSERKINMLKERGMEKEAEEAVNQQHQENKEIMLSFEETFDFCPVYFFYAANSEAIREGQLEGNVFNSRQELIEGSKLNTRPFFTAEFAETEKLGISGFILMDQFMVPLEPPFPYFERKYIFFSLIEQSKARISERHNARLKAFYEKHLN